MSREKTIDGIDKILTNQTGFLWNLWGTPDGGRTDCRKCTKNRERIGKNGIFSNVCGP